MNVEGLAVERLAGKRIFNSLHAAFSFGASPAGCHRRASPRRPGSTRCPTRDRRGGRAVAATFASAGCPAAGEPPPEGPRFARPSRRLAALGAIAFCALLAEGAVFDWSGIYMRRETGAALGLAPAGLAAFNLAMGFGRLSADSVSARVGSSTLGGRAR